MPKFLLFNFVWLLFLLQFHDAARGSPAWPNEPYPYSVVDQDLRLVLREFGKNTGIRVEVSRRVDGRVRSKPPTISAREFFFYLCKTYGLEWYYDGFTLHVTAASENETRFLDGGEVDTNALQGELSRLGFSDPRFPIKLSSNNRSILVSGPPRFVTLVEQTLRRMASPAFAQGVIVPTQTVIYRGGSVSVVTHGSVPAAAPAAEQ